MKNRKFGAKMLAATSSFALSAAERRMGRLMRAPDEHVDPIEAMMKDDGVEGNMRIPGQPAPKKDAAPTEDDGEEPEASQDGEEESGDEDADEGEEKDVDEKPKKPKKTASDRIKELNRELQEARRRERALQEGYEARLERLEKGLPAQKSDDSKVVERVAPDPDDLEKYPLGRLDDRYIEDKLEYLAEEKADKLLGSVLQRQQESDQLAEAERIAAEANTKISEISAKGVELFDDFVEVAVERAKKMEYPLEEATFHAVTEAEYGAEILYNLASDLKEAERVAKLSPYQQTKYVLEKNNEIAAGKPKPRLPKAGDPPKNLPRGANTRFSVPGDTDDLEAFGKEFDKI